MKKWLFVLGVFICSLLFFISGALVGYSVYDKQLKTVTTQDETQTRKPSKGINPLIGFVMNTQATKLRSRVRLPSNPAISKARRYQPLLHGAVTH